MSLVSAQIVTHNNEETIGLCLRSLRQQSLKNCSVLVVDNGSRDHTLKLISKSGLRLVRNQTNLGYAAGHNQGLEVIKHSKYVLTLNPDVALHKDFIRNLVVYLEKVPKTIGSASGILLRVNSLQKTSQKVDGAGLFMRKNRRQGLLYENQSLANCPKSPMSIFGPDGAAAFYRREMLEDIRLGKEYFDEDFFIHKEDVDLCWRAQLRGWQSVLIPNALGYHVRNFRPGRRQQVSPLLRRLAIRNRYFLMLKNEIPRHFLMDLHHILLYDLGILAYVLLREPESLAAYFSLLRYLPKMLRKRRLIQGKRRASYQKVQPWFV